MLNTEVLQNAPPAPASVPELLQEEPEVEEEPMEVIVVEDDDDKEDAAQGDGQPPSPP